MHKSILLVEDSHDDEVLTVRALRKAKVANEIVVVRDGAAALDFLFARGAYAERDPAELPWLVLLDLKLPKLDGHKVLEAIRNDKRTKRLPVVVLTSSDMGRDIDRSYELGANSFVSKPVRFEEFSKAVREVGLYWLVFNRPPAGHA